MKMNSKQKLNMEAGERRGVVCLGRGGGGGGGGGGGRDSEQRAERVTLAESA